MIRLTHKITHGEVSTEHVIGLFSNQYLVAVYDVLVGRLWKIIDMHKQPANASTHVQTFAKQLKIDITNVDSVTRVTLEKLFVKGLQHVS